MGLMNPFVVHIINLH